MMNDGIADPGGSRRHGRVSRRTRSGPPDPQPRSWRGARRLRAGDRVRPASGRRHLHPRVRHAARPVHLELGKHQRHRAQLCRRPDAVGILADLRGDHDRHRHRRSRRRITATSSRCRWSVTGHHALHGRWVASRTKQWPSIPPPASCTRRKTPGRLRVLPIPSERAGLARAWRRARDARRRADVRSSIRGTNQTDEWLDVEWKLIDDPDPDLGSRRHAERLLARASTKAARGSDVSRVRGTATGASTSSRRAAATPGRDRSSSSIR